MKRYAWWLVAALLIHVLEEVWWFPEWATRHFGTTTTSFFLVSHIPLFAVAIWAAWGASRSVPVKGSVWVVLAFTVALVANAVFHVAATMAFMEYSPGLLTALLCFPAVAWVTWSEGASQLSTIGRMSAAVLGVVASALVAWSLVLDAPGAPEFVSVSDPEYLTSEVWNDGQAEVAFYKVRRTQNQYGRQDEQEFLAGTYLVKHDFDEGLDSKATPDSEQSVSAFKYALFYEFESLSYEYKRSWVVNLEQSGLRPLKATFASFDWCSNEFREFSFAGSGEVEHLYRSDDYGNASDHWSVSVQAYPPSAIPVLVRALDLSSGPVTFPILSTQGTTVSVTATLDGQETIQGIDSDRISLAYDGEVESMLGETTSEEELWWRARGGDRRILAARSVDGRYSMNLVELVRSAYWEEDVYDRLEQITERP